MQPRDIILAGFFMGRPAARFKFERTFGMRATPIEEAIKATVAWYRAHPVSK